MGYNHYYYVTREFDKKAFEAVAADFYRMVNPLKHLGVILAGWRGLGCPVITPTRIKFNGQAKCGHEQREMAIPFPADDAAGVARNGVGTTDNDVFHGHNILVTMLKTRVCGGNCSHEPFDLMQTYAPSAYNGSIESPNSGSESAITKGKYSNACKTAFKPYDLAVQVCMVIAKHHLGDAIATQSSGVAALWVEASQLCQHFLGYGGDFCLDL